MVDVADMGGYWATRRQFYIDHLERVDIDIEKEDRVRAEFGSDKNGLFYGRVKK